MEIIKDSHPAQYYDEMDLNDIEPFTIVLRTGGYLYECRWDGEKKYKTKLNNKSAYLWSSATLFDNEAAKKRESWFRRWLQNGIPERACDIIDFHSSGGKDDLENGLVINRNGLMKTMSITNVQVSPGNINMTYIDMQDNTQTATEMELTQVQPTAQNKLPRFLNIRVFFIKLFNWEYWSFNVVYLPVMYYWFWLSLKSRSLFFFSPSNPLLKNGGFALESKKAIYDFIPQKYYPKTLLFKAGAHVNDIQRSLNDMSLSYPLIAKPDIGGRGVQVKLVNSAYELLAYVKQIKVDFLVQEHVPYKNEVGIFYYRLPGEAVGHVTGVVGKEFLKVTGDGRSTIQQLLVKESRYLLQLNSLLHTEGNRLKEVLPAGTSLTLVPYGNHARGAKFIDLSHLISPQLTTAIDEVCRQIPEFYYGRMDVMYNTWEELSRGENFSIIELNGASAEPAHIYDSGHYIFYAWKEIIRHWKLLYQISELNNQRKGIAYMSYKEGVEMLKLNTAYSKLVA